MSRLDDQWSYLITKHNLEAFLALHDMTLHYNGNETKGEPILKK